MSASVKMRAGRSLARLESSSTKSLGFGFGKEPELLKWQMDAVMGSRSQLLGLSVNGLPMCSTQYPSSKAVVPASKIISLLFPA